MSLATKQLILQAESDRDDALRRLSVGEDTPKVRQLLQEAKNKMARFQKQYDEELAQAKAKAKAKTNVVQTEAKKERRSNKEGRLPIPEDIELSCVDCASHFPFTGKDQMFYTKNNYAAPIRCATCRQIKKDAKPDGKQIQCQGCKTDFFFSDAKAAIFEEKGWAPPKWCSTCKANRSQKVTAKDKDKDE